MKYNTEVAFKASFTDTNTTTDVSIKCIFPWIWAINNNHSMLQYNLKQFLTFK